MRFRITTPGFRNEAYLQVRVTWQAQSIIRGWKSMYRAGAGGTDLATLSSRISHGTRLPVVKGCSAFSCMPTSFLFPSQVIFSTLDNVIA
jgi:hypothetical protein